MNDSHQAESLKDWAIKYAKKGYRVLPLYGITSGRCDCKRSTCTSPGKHPYMPIVPHGEKNATDDVELVKKWWKEYPNANIGLIVDGVCVIDVDGRKGLESLKNLGELPKTATVRTGRGHHYYFKGDIHE